MFREMTPIYKDAFDNHMGMRTDLTVYFENDVYNVVAFGNDQAWVCDTKDDVQELMDIIYSQCNLPSKKVFQ